MLIVHQHLKTIEIEQESRRDGRDPDPIIIEVDECNAQVAAYDAKLVAQRYGWLSGAARDELSAIASKYTARHVTKAAKVVPAWMRAYGK